ncbi:hypothetical protein SEA_SCOOBYDOOBYDOO_130 [Mycobacterium phage ScoobyDoobyDoo]|nr:hypothetical protein SEA_SCOOBYDOOBYDOO_130 [Mycobacterium phage ScoobyDoobyDoo]
MPVLVSRAVIPYRSDILSATFTTVGAWSWDIPFWVRKIEVVLIGGGGAGEGMNVAGIWGEGGRGGQWQGAVFVRGEDIPNTATQITGTVGQGGVSTFGAGNPGQPTIAYVNGSPILTANGGRGGSASNLDTPGRSPGNFTFNGVTYIGGAQQDGQSSTGYAPGGGGGGSRVSLTTGGMGGRGQAWIRAYQ